MPRYPTYSIFDKATGRQYQMPWHDPYNKPEDEQIAAWVHQQDNPGILDRLTTPLTNAISEHTTKPIADWMYKQGGDQKSIYGSMMRGAGTATDFVGGMADSFTSPAGIATAFAGPALGMAAKGLGVAGKAGMAARAATAGNLLQRGAAGTQVVAAGKNIYEDPSGMNILANAPGLAFGALGLKYGGGYAAGTPKPPPIDGGPTIPGIGRPNPYRPTFPGQPASMGHPAPGGGGGGGGGPRQQLQLGSGRPTRGLLGPAPRHITAGLEEFEQAPLPMSSDLALPSITPDARSPYPGLPFNGEQPTPTPRPVRGLLGTGSVTSRGNANQVGQQGPFEAGPPARARGAGGRFEPNAYIGEQPAPAAPRGHLAIKSLEKTKTAREIADDAFWAERDAAKAAEAEGLKALGGGVRKIQRPEGTSSLGPDTLEAPQAAGRNRPVFPNERIPQPAPPEPPAPPKALTYREKADAALHKATGGRRGTPAPETIGEVSRGSTIGEVAEVGSKTPPPDTWNMKMVREGFNKLEKKKGVKDWEYKALIHGYEDELVELPAGETWRNRAIQFLKDNEAHQAKLGDLSSAPPLRQNTPAEASKTKPSGGRKLKGLGKDKRGRQFGFSSPFGEVSSPAGVRSGRGGGGGPRTPKAETRSAGRSPIDITEEPTGSATPLGKVGPRGIYDPYAVEDWMKKTGEAVRGSKVGQKAAEVSELPGARDVKDASLGLFEGLGQSGKHLVKKYGGKKMLWFIEKARIKADKFAVENGLDKDSSGMIVNQMVGPEIQEMIRASSNPEKLGQVLNKWLGKTQTPDTAFNKGIKAATGIQAATKLSQFPLSNLPNAAMTVMRGSTSSLRKALKEVTGDYKAANTAAAKTGVHRAVVKDIQDEMGKWTDKWFGIGKSEEIQRTLAASTGKHEAEHLFAKFKKNPNHAVTRAKLEDLLLEDADDILKLDKLTPDHLDTASARMSEITQGRAESIDLPPLWTSSPSANMITQFKRYAFTQTRNMKEALKVDPVKTVATMLTVFPAMGAAVGWSKDQIRGIVQGVYTGEDVSKMIAEAREKRGKGFDNYMNSMGTAWGLGIFQDLYEASQRGESGLLEAIAGPTAGEASTALSALNKIKDEGNFGPLKRQGLRAIPYVGTALAGVTKDTNPERRKSANKPLFD